MSVPSESKFHVLTFVDQSRTMLLSLGWTRDASGPRSVFSTFCGWTSSVLDRVFLFRCKGGWRQGPVHEVLVDVETLFLLFLLCLPRSAFRARMGWYRSFGNLALDEVKVFSAHGDLWRSA